MRDWNYYEFDCINGWYCFVKYIYTPCTGQHEEAETHYLMFLFFEYYVIVYFLVGTDDRNVSIFWGVCMCCEQLTMPDLPDDFVFFAVAVAFFTVGCCCELWSYARSAIKRFNKSYDWWWHIPGYYIYCQFLLSCLFGRIVVASPLFSFC